MIYSLYIHCMTNINNRATPGSVHLFTPLLVQIDVYFDSDILLMVLTACQ